MSSAWAGFRDPCVNLGQSLPHSGPQFFCLKRRGWIKYSLRSIGVSGASQQIPILPGIKSRQSRFDARSWMLGGWCTGTTQRDGMGREEGGGFRMGNTCIPVADSF